MFTGVKDQVLSQVEMGLVWGLGGEHEALCDCVCQGRGQWSCHKTNINNKKEYLLTILLTILLNMYLNSLQ